MEQVDNIVAELQNFFLWIFINSQFIEVSIASAGASDDDDPSTSKILLSI